MTREGPRQAGTRIRSGFSRRTRPRVWRHRTLKATYDVVIIGAGVHGLATAYYLATNFGVTNVAIVDRGFVGGHRRLRPGTAVSVSDTLNPLGAATNQHTLNRHTIELSQALADELKVSLTSPEPACLRLAHSGGDLRALRWRAEVDRLRRISSELIEPLDCKQLAPVLDVSARPRFPILGALHYPSGHGLDHDRLCRAYAVAADSKGVEIHEKTTVTDIVVTGGEGGPGGARGKGPAGIVGGLRTTRGDISAPIVLNCATGWASIVSSMAGIELAATTHLRQQIVSEPVKSFLPVVLASQCLSISVGQTRRGELVIDGPADPLSSYSVRSTFEFGEEQARHVLDLMPGIGSLRAMQQRNELCDVTPDGAPIMGLTAVTGFLCNIGWAPEAFGSGPVSGQTMADCVATGTTPETMLPLAPSRFRNGLPIGTRSVLPAGRP